MKLQVISLFAVLTLTTISTTYAQDHGHLNVGALSTNQNEPLIFENGNIFATASDYVKTLTFTTSGANAGYYAGNITLTALAATEAHLTTGTNFPALGSRIFAQLASVDGPPGGSFAFWDTGATSPTISLTTGQTGTNTWVLSENDGSPGTDPFGHIHGRRFTLTKPGIYVVGFRAFDFSTNGLGGGPIHTPSTVFKMYFQAGDNLHSVARLGNQANIRFGARAGFSWQLEATPSLVTPDWQPVGDPISGDDYFHAVLDATLVVSNRFYRIEGTPIIP